MIAYAVHAAYPALPCAAHSCCQDGVGTRLGDRHPLLISQAEGRTSGHADECVWPRIPLPSMKALRCRVRLVRKKVRWVQEMAFLQVVLIVSEDGAIVQSSKNLSDLSELRKLRAQRVLPLDASLRYFQSL